MSFLLAFLPTFSLTSILAAVAGIFLLVELYKRIFLSFDDDVPTFLVLPFVNRPPPGRLLDIHDYDKETTWKLSSPVIRSVSIHKPWTHTLLIGDPVVLKDLYVGPNWEVYDRSHPFAQKHQNHAGGLILMGNGPKWRAAREHLGTKTFSSTTIKNSYVPLMREQFSIFVEQVEKERKANNGKIDLQDFFNNATFDLITRLVFGEEVRAQTTKEGAAYLEAWDNLLGLSNIFVLLHGLAGPWIWKLFPKMNQKYDHAKDMIYSLVERNLARRRRGEDLDRISILDDFMRNEKVPDWLKEDDEITRQLVTLLFAGHDTTSALLSFMTVELARHPVWQQRVREEVIEAFGKPKDGDLITNLDKLEALPILNACLKETLRVFPSAPYGGGRVMADDYKFVYTGLDNKQHKIDFRKGDQILPSMYIAQMYPDYWNEKAHGPVSEWNPQRFLDDPNGGAQSMFCYAPFGNGARRCAGERLALGEARLTMSELVRRYQWRLQDGFEFKVLMTGTIKARNGVKVVLEPLEA